MNIIAVQSNDCFYISNAAKEAYRGNNLKGLLFDGVEAEKTFHSDWLKIKKQPKSIVRMEAMPDINHRFVLVDESMASDTVKNVLIREDIAEYVEYEWVWKDDIAHLRSLYKSESDKQEDKSVNVEFTFTVILVVNAVEEGGEFSYTVPAGRYKSDGKTKIDNGNVKQQIIDTIVFPAITHRSKTCSLTSEQTYKIVREHILTNINPNFAVVTSDYDFCFTVKKKIDLSEVEKYTVDVNFMTKRKPKMEIRLARHRKVEIFEMTHSGSNYKSYTPIKGIVGKSHKDLKTKLDSYLKNLMEFINSPVVDCPHCKGLGVINPERQND